ncbi:conserved protein, unknown function [Hepatocystis sp. ex Piliocolobus tephrosceles]|nr:conserved protein, unknown function [Hepatocystis sp. ex Piliocolobus tephrosceles]
MYRLRNVFLFIIIIIIVTLNKLNEGRLTHTIIPDNNYNRSLDYNRLLSYKILTIKFCKKHCFNKKEKYIYKNNLLTINSSLLNIYTKKNEKKEKRRKKYYYSSIKELNFNKDLNIKIHKQITKLINKILFYNKKDEAITIHPLKNCIWKINTYNFFLKKQKTFYIYIYEDGHIKTSDNLKGTWFYNDYYLTWCIEDDEKKIYYTAELLWNNEKSKMIKGIIYEEKKKKEKCFIPSYFFRKILGSFDGTIHTEN